MKISLAIFLMLAATVAVFAQKPATTPKLHASAIQIDVVNVGDVSIPAEFRYAIYERLIEQVRASGIFQKVYRSGDKAAPTCPDLVTLHTSVEAFQEGSQMKRELVPVVVGNTKVDVTTQRDRPGRKDASGSEDGRQSPDLRREPGRHQRSGQADHQAAGRELLARSLQCTIDHRARQQRRGADR